MKVQAAILVTVLMRELANGRDVSFRRAGCGDLNLFPWRPMCAYRLRQFGGSAPEIAFFSWENYIDGGRPQDFLVCLVDGTVLEVDANA